MRAVSDARATVIAACALFPRHRDHTCDRHRFMRAVLGARVAVTCACKQFPTHRNFTCAKDALDARI